MMWFKLNANELRYIYNKSNYIYLFLIENIIYVLIILFNFAVNFQY